jgi:CrcB protein
MSTSISGRRGGGTTDPMRRSAAPLAVLAGGLLGSGVRAAILLAWPIDGDAFPFPTLAINLTGALFLGFYLARRQQAVAGPHSVPFWAIGVLGSFTTFSLFSLEVFELLDAGQAAPAIAYVVVSTVGGVALAISGQRIGETAG